MSSPRDPVDDWLAAGVPPLGPPPGTLQRIRHRARRRKVRQATFAAAGCAVVLVAAIVTPTLVSGGGQQPGHGHPALAGPQSSPAISPRSSGTNVPTPEATQSTQLQQHTTLGHSWTVPPANFQPTSVTFVGTGNNTVIGAVIGQAGVPGQCATNYCTSLAGTSDYGASWYGVSAPLAPGANASAGVSQLRFASLADGWAFGPALYETSQGGWPWKRENTHGQRVIALEAVQSRAFAVFGQCSGSGSDYASSCTSYSLWTSVPGSTTWTPVAMPAGDQTITAASGTPRLVIGGGTTGYLLTPSGDLLTGPVSGGSWRSAGQTPCAAGAAAPGGGAAGASTLLASGPAGLLLACESAAAGGGGTATVYSSASGATWHRAGQTTVGGTLSSLTSAAPGQVVLATTAGLQYSADGGASWHGAKFAGTPPGGGFRYAGMTNKTQGVAVPVDAALGAIWVTSDGGRSWHPAPISS